MGLVNTQLVVVEHRDRADNRHVHILANRVNNEGRTISDRFHRLRAQEQGQLVCAAHNLTPPGGQRPRQQHPERIVGAGDQARARMRQALGLAVETACTRTQLWQALRAQGLTVRESARGVSFALRGYHAKGSQLAREYGLPQLDQRLAANQAVRLTVQRQARQVLDAVLHAPTLRDVLDYRTRVEAKGYRFMDAAATRTHLRHEASGQVFALAALSSGPLAGAPLAAQVRGAVVQREQLRQQALDTVAGILASGLRSEDHFAARLQARGYQTGALGLRPASSRHAFSWAEVTPGGPAAGQLTEQLATAVQAEQQQHAAGRDLVTTALRAVETAGRFRDQASLGAALREAGVGLEHDARRAGSFQLRHLATQRLYAEAAVLPAGRTMAHVLTEAAARGSAARESLRRTTQELLTQLLYATTPPPATLRAYWQQVAAHGYRLQPDPAVPRRTGLQHTASGEQFQGAEVRPGGPQAPSIAQQLATRHEAVRRDQELHVLTACLEQVLAAERFSSVEQARARVAEAGYLMQRTPQGSPCFLHVASERRLEAASVRPNGRSFEEQVSTLLERRQTEWTEGIITVGPSATKPAAARAELVRSRLRQAGADVTLLAASPDAPPGHLLLHYQHPLRSPHLAAINEELGNLQLARIAVHERQAPKQPRSAWPARRGEYCQAQVLLADSAERSAGERAQRLRRACEQAGAQVTTRALAADGRWEVNLSFHSVRTDLPQLHALLEHGLRRPDTWIRGYDPPQAPHAPSREIER